MGSRNLSSDFLGICILPSLNPGQVAARHSVSRWMEGRNGRAFNGPTSRKGHHRKIAQRERGRKRRDGCWCSLFRTRSPWISGNRNGIPMEFQTKGREREREGETGSSLAFHAFRAGFVAVVVQSVCIILEQSSVYACLFSSF